MVFIDVYSIVHAGECKNKALGTSRQKKGYRRGINI